MIKTILFVDSNPVLLRTMVGLLKNQSNFLQFRSAASVEQAIDILAGAEIHLLITGMSLPETDVYKLALLISNHAQVRMILMTLGASANFRNKISNIASIVHFSDLRDIGLLGKRIFTELQIDFGGQLHTTNIVSFVQVMEMEERSCTLLVTAKGKSGALAFTEGKLCAAETGSLTGNEAALEILSWRHVSIDIDYTFRAMPRDISMSLMNLLLESGQTVDERRSRQASLRRHKRYACAGAAQYRIEQRIFQCYLRDISVGGAYLEIDQEIELGQALTLLLPRSSGHGGTPIPGTVVRRDHVGVGIQFETLTSEQKQRIRSLVLSRRSAKAMPLHSAA